MSIFRNSYIPPYVKPNLKWFERDGLITYIDRLKYEEFEENRDKYLKNIKITNMDIIHNECRGDPLEKDIKEYKTIQKKDVKQMPASDKHAALAACFRSEKKDLFISEDLRQEYFKTWNSSTVNKKICSKDTEALKKKQQKYFECW